jgi:ABC-2 type transport system permease protein
MLNLLRVEFYKLKTSKTFLAIVLLSVLQSILCPILFSRTMTGKEVLVMVLQSQPFLGFFILIGVFTAYFIGDEFSSKYIKNFISYGHKRRDIVIAKIIVYYIGIAIISLISPILITIINTFMNGYGEVFTLNSYIFIFRVFALMLIIYIGLSSIAVLIAYTSKNMIIIAPIFIGIDFMNRAAMFFSRQNNFVNSIYTNTIFGQLISALADNISFLQMIKVIAIALTTVAVSTGLSIYSFEKVDIK